MQSRGSSEESNSWKTGPNPSPRQRENAASLMGAGPKCPARMPSPRLVAPAAGGSPLAEAPLLEKCPQLVETDWYRHKSPTPDVGLPQPHSYSAEKPPSAHLMAGRVQSPALAEDLEVWGEKFWKQDRRRRSEGQSLDGSLARIPGWSTKRHASAGDQGQAGRREEPALQRHSGARRCVWVFYSFGSTHSPNTCTVWVAKGRNLEAWGVGGMEYGTGRAARK